MRICGLDASSSTIGYSILDYSNDKIELIAADYIKPPKKGNLFNRLIKTQELVSEIFKKYKPDVVGIEDIAKFMAGASTATTIIILAVFNRAVGIAATNYLGHPPALFNVMKIRHGIKLTSTLPKKEEIPELVEKYLNIRFPYIIKNNERIDENLDIADSIAVALYTKKRLDELNKNILSAKLLLDIDYVGTSRKKATNIKKQLKLDLEEYLELTGKNYES